METIFLFGTITANDDEEGKEEKERPPTMSFFFLSSSSSSSSSYSSSSFRPEEGEGEVRPRVFVSASCCNEQIYLFFFFREEP